MQRTNYAQVRQLAKGILVEYKRMALLSDSLQHKVKTLEGTFLDDSIDQVKDFTNALITDLVNAQDLFFSVANELAEYARLLEAGKRSSGISMKQASSVPSFPMTQAAVSNDSDTAEITSVGSTLASVTNFMHRKKNVRESLKGVAHRPIVRASVARSEQQIINSISGGDMTEGSCSSLALAYAGNRAGYIVYDFRDGQSRATFSSRHTIDQLANLDGVDSTIICGTDDTKCAERLMSTMEPGKEYYLATGAHAAVVRVTPERHYQYLELQSGTPSENGWHPLTLNALYARFGCEDGQYHEYANYLIELGSLQSNTEFLDLLGYINTDESAQRRGASGHVR